MQIYKGFGLDMPYGVVSAKVNNHVEGLNFRVYHNKDVEFLDISSESGLRTYVRSLCFVLCKAVADVFPDGQILLEHPVSRGYYCSLRIGREPDAFAHQMGKNENSGLTSVGKPRIIHFADRL